MAEVFNPMGLRGVTGAAMLAGTPAMGASKAAEAVAAGMQTRAADMVLREDSEACVEAMTLRACAQWYSQVSVEAKARAADMETGGFEAIAQQ